MQRTQQATVLNAFVKQVLAADPNANVVLAGDFNDYQFSAPIQTLTDNGATLTDLITTLPENERYTYVFNGVSQVLDHIFVTKPIDRRASTRSSTSTPSSPTRPPTTTRRSSGSARPCDRAPSPSTRRRCSSGQSTTIRLAGWYPNRTFAITLDGASIGSVTTDAAGAAALPLAITSAISLGTHTVRATSSTDGATATATLDGQDDPRHRGALAAQDQVRASSSRSSSSAGRRGVTLTVSLDGTTTPRDA